MRNGDLLISVSKMSDPRYETLVAAHELIEAMLCRQAGISERAVDAFDRHYEAHRKAGDQSEPGDDPRAPYHRQHVAATKIERELAALLGVVWATIRKRGRRASVARRGLLAHEPHRPVPVIRQRLKCSAIRPNHARTGPRRDPKALCSKIERQKTSISVRF